MCFLSENKHFSYISALLLSIVGGYLFTLIHFPLPWMLGPLFFVGVAGLMGVGVKSVPASRQAGQLVVGCGLGLYFTAGILPHLLNYKGYIIITALLAILIGALGGILLKFISGVTSSTAFFASVPGGAAEMAVLAERAGGRFDQVALCHSIRVLMVVSIIPFAINLSGASGQDTSYIPHVVAFSFNGLGLFLLIAATAGFIFMKIGIPNAWLLGPLLISIVLTLNGITFSSIPPILSVIAQILIGCSLGSRFHPSLRSESRSLIIGVIASSALTMFLSFFLALLLAWLMNESPASLILAAAPGGLSEMCLTAKILNLGVPLVTSFQVARLIVVVTGTLPIWQFLKFLKEKW